LGLASLQELAAHSAASLSHSKVAMALQKKKKKLPLPTIKKITLQKICSERHRLINYTSTTEMPKQWIQIINVAARFGILTPVLTKFRSSGNITPRDVVSGR